MFRLLYPSSVFELHTYVGAYHQPLSLKQSFLTFNLMMIAVIGACLERGLLPAAAIERGVIYVLAGDIAASRYTANPVISQQIMPFFRGILSNFFWISLTTYVGKDRNCKHPMFKSASLHPSLFDFHSAQRYNVKTDTTHTSIIKHPKGCSCSNLKPVLVTLVRLWHVQVVGPGLSPAFRATHLVTYTFQAKIT